MKKQMIKIGLDVVMGVLWLVLMTYRLTDAFWHELLGLSMLGLLAVHLFLNAAWIAGMTKKLFRTRFTINTFRYLCDVLLLLLSVFTIVSGVLISRELLTEWYVTDYDWWVVLHNWSAYGCLALTGIHIGLHWKMILSLLRRLFHLRGVSVARRVLWNAVSLAIVAFGLKSSVTYQLPVVQTTEPAAEPVSTDTVNDTDTVSARVTAYAQQAAAPVQTLTAVVQTEEKASAGVVLTADVPSSGETLEDFLGRLVCSGCSRHCSLLSPRCGRGQEQAVQAQETYEAAAAAQADEPTDTPQAPESTTASAESTTTASATGSSAQTTTSTQTTTTTTTAAAITPAQTTTQNGGGLTQHYLLDDFCILGMYVAGTYYVLQYADYRKRRKCPHK